MCSDDVHGVHPSSTGTALPGFLCVQDLQYLRLMNWLSLSAIWQSSCGVHDAIGTSVDALSSELTTQHRATQLDENMNTRSLHTEQMHKAAHKERGV